MAATSLSSWERDLSEAIRLLDRLSSRATSADQQADLKVLLDLQRNKLDRRTPHVSR